MKTLPTISCQGLRPVVASVLLGLFFCLVPGLRAEHDHNNIVYLNFYDAANNPLGIMSAHYEYSGQEIESDQNPDNHEPAMSFTAGDSQLTLSFDVGRHASNTVATDFQTAVTGPTGQPNVLTNGINDNDNTYYCQKMNFYFYGDVKWIQISDDEYISIPNLFLGQSSNSFLKIALTIFQAIGATAWDSFMEAADIEDGDEFGALKDGGNIFNDVISGGESISAAFDNFWLVTQSLQSFNTSDFILGTTNASASSGGDEDGEDVDDLSLPNPFNPPSLPDKSFPIVATAFYQNTSSGQTYLMPIYISSGSDDHSFNITVPYPFTTSSSAEPSATGTTPAAVFSDATQVKDNYFLDPSIGIFEKIPGSPWINCLSLGWCYPDGDYAPDLWIYAEEEDDWYYVSKDLPGSLYKDRTGIWYAYDSATVRFYPIFTMEPDAE